MEFSTIKFDEREPGIGIITLNRPDRLNAMTQKMLEERPETVKRFKKALLQAWREALDPENKDKAIETVLRYNQEIPKDIVRKQLPATRILILPEPDFEFGKIDVAAWKQTEQIMLAQKLIAGPVHIENRLNPVIK